MQTSVLFPLFNHWYHNFTQDALASCLLRVSQGDPCRQCSSEGIPFARAAGIFSSAMYLMLLMIYNQDLTLV